MSPTPPSAPPETTSRPTQARLGDLGIVFGMAARYPLQIAAALIALLVAALATLAIPNGFRLIIDRGFAGHGGDIGRWFLYLTAIVAVLAVASSIRFYFVSWIGERVVADVRRAVQTNLLRLSPSFFEENRPSEIASRLTADTTVIDQVVGTTISVALRNAVMGVGGILYLFYLAPKLALWILIGIPIVILPIMLFGRRLRTLSKTGQDRVADVGSMVSEVLGAMKIVQAFGQQVREAARFAAAVETAFDAAKRRIATRALLTAVGLFLIFGSITWLMWRGALGVQTGDISGGTIAAFVLTGVITAGAVGNLTETYGDLMRGAAAAQRIGELIRAEPTIQAPPAPATLPQAHAGVRFDGITFRYPTRPEVSALADFSLAIRPGETVAVVGPSGAGKSTLFQLLLRFYDPQAGRVLVDDIDIRDISPDDLRARMAVVPQETVIFAASARDNLRYGRWDAEEDEIWSAAEAANAADFLRALPQGLDTFLGEGGARLSGGQRQRLAIARALLRDAPILLLDEATSALDAESERLVQSALERLMVGRTTLVIAHRLATVRAADRIIVMDEGRIVEEGRHDTLAQAGGLYERLARLQFDA